MYNFSLLYRAYGYQTDAASLRVISRLYFFRRA